MRVLPFAISTITTVLLIILLSTSFGSVPPLGKFLSPQHGFWLNAESVGKDFNEQLHFTGLNGKASVYFDDRLVPHVFAENDDDLYFVQGYLHAKFRLWQMEFQTHAAAGRLSSILGVGPDSAFLNHDRMLRRMGMVYGAQNSLASIEADQQSKSACDAYTAGVNSYIDQLDNRDLPVEYRLLNYTPEHWSNLKTCLFLMYMRYDLTGGEDDIELTNMRSVFNRYTLDKLFPITQDSLDPIVPFSTVFDSAEVKLRIPSSVDSLYYGSKDSAQVYVNKPDPDNGSNNWAVNGNKTASGRPILCNDPHLGVNLPSLWYEMQLTSPSHNVYGVSFPGAPSIVIGFNDSIAWGVTNAQRDVKDYYTIDFDDPSHANYKFNGGSKKTEFKIEEYLVKGGPAFYDTVAYTVFGPVMYDEHYNGRGRTAGQSLAVKWKAHESGNELKALMGLNAARNYNQYITAISNFHCPGQNFVFASKSNEIAIWQQGDFPAKWLHQGDYIMPGNDTSYSWQGNIPMRENPHVLNPEYGFVSSANQLPTDTTYPYYLSGHFDMYRGKMINRFLERMNRITPVDMQRLQNENENLFAESILPLMLRNILRSSLTDSEQGYLQAVEAWNFRNDPDEKGPTIFQNWFDELEKAVWLDELNTAPRPWKLPSDYTLVEALLRDSAFSFIDNISTPEQETLQQVITDAFKRAMPAIADADKGGKLAWSKYKDSGVRHLLRLEPFSRFHLRTGGGDNVINATKQFHAPSWRMIVELTDDVQAYGIYPGGQSGNPGSKFYDNFVDDWAAGKYNALWFMNQKQQTDQRVKFVMTFSKS